MAILGTNKNECKICGFIGRSNGGPRNSISAHLKYTHNMTRQQYYDKYLKEVGDGFCKFCKKPTKFQDNFYFKYRDYCSDTCRSKNSKLIKTHNYNQEMMHLIRVKNGKKAKGSFSAKTLNKMSRLRSEKNKSHIGIGYKKYFYMGVIFKSSWERDFAKLCDNARVKWKYEPETFIYGKNKKFRYTPDFYLPKLDRWIEIKPKKLVTDKVVDKLNKINNKYNIKVALLDKNDFKDFYQDLRVRG